jgi:16S rRNA (cytosine967-C5)-methyltransferase
MTPGARLQAAIDLLSAIHAGASPADRVSAAFFRERRYIGGSDRRAVIDRVYEVLRRRAALDWWLGQAGAPSDRLRMIAALALIDGWTADRIAGSFDGGKYRPAPLEEDERRLAKTLEGKALLSPDQPEWVRFEFPEWMTDSLHRLFGPRLEPEMGALRAEAPLDLRVNTLKTTRDEAAAALALYGIEAKATPLSPLGLRVPGRPPLATLSTFQDGLVEVQDEGSQLAALLADAQPGMRVVDFCAGAGGKTLAMAAAMENKGRLVACDVLQGRVERAAARLQRAGVHNVERRGLTSENDPWVKRHAGGFERVLVDAPCTGVGTWRRNPDAKWKLTPAYVKELVDLQQRILASAARLVKPGGRLIYATCSLLPEENETQIEGFLARQADFSLLPIADVWRDSVGRHKYAGPCPATDAYLRLTPAQHGTDGFFVAVLQRSAAAKPAPESADAEPPPEASDD